MKKVLVIGTAQSGPTTVQKWNVKKDMDLQLKDAELIYGTSIVDYTKLFNPITDKDIRVHHERELITFLRQAETLLHEKDAIEFYTKRITHGTYSEQIIHDAMGAKDTNIIAMKALDKPSIKISASVIGDESNNFQLEINNNRIMTTYTITYIKPNNNSFTDEFLNIPLVITTTYANTSEFLIQLRLSPWSKYLKASDFTYNFASDLIHERNELYTLPDVPQSYRIEPYGLCNTYKHSINQSIYVLQNGLIPNSIKITNAIYTKTFNLQENTIFINYSNISVQMGDPIITNITSDTLTKNQIDLTRFPSIEIKGVFTAGDTITIDLPIELKMLGNLSTDIYGNKNNLYGLRLSIDPLGTNLIEYKNNIPTEDELKYDIEYETQISEIKLINSGNSQIGYIKNMIQRDLIYESIKVTKGLIGVILEAYDNVKYNELFKLLHDNKTIPVEFDTLIIMALNYELHDLSYLTYLPDLENEKQIIEYNIIDVMMTKLNILYPIYFSYNIEPTTLLPKVRIPKNIHNHMIKTTLLHKTKPHIPAPGTYTINNGTDKHTYTDNEYLDALMDEFVNENKYTLGQHVSIWGITDIVVLGTYIDSFNNQYKINKFESEYQTNNIFIDPIDDSRYITITPNDWLHGTNLIIKDVYGNTGMLNTEIRENNKIVILTDDGTLAETKFPIYIKLEYQTYLKNYIPFAELTKTFFDEFNYVTTHFGFYPFIKDISNNIEEDFETYLRNIMISPSLSGMQTTNSIWATICNITIDDVQYMNYANKEYIHPFFLNHITSYQAIEIYNTHRLLFNITQELELRTDKTIDAQVPTNINISLTQIKQLFYEKGIMWFYTPQADNQAILFTDNTDYITETDVLKIGTYSYIAKTLQYELANIVIKRYEGTTWNAQEAIQGLTTYTLGRFPNFILNCNITEDKDKFNELNHTRHLVIKIGFSLPFANANWKSEIAFFMDY